MQDAIKIFLGFVVGFGLWEVLNAALGDRAVEPLRLALDIVGPAFITTALVVAFERYRTRKQAEG